MENGSDAPDPLVERMNEIDAYAVVYRVKSLFDQGILDPNYDEIISGLLGVDISLVTDELRAILRGVMPLVRRTLEDDGIIAVSIGATYYEPSGRTGFRPRPGRMFPPTFRDSPPQTDDEARSCLAGTGRNASFGLKYIDPDTCDADLIFVAARAKDIQSAASRSRGAIDKLLGSGLGDQHQAQLLSRFDEQSRPDRSEALLRLRAEMPKLLGQAAE
jgi:hypothetical protein